MINLYENDKLPEMADDIQNVFCQLSGSVQRVEAMEALLQKGASIAACAGVITEMMDESKQAFEDADKIWHDPDAAESESETAE